MIIHGDCLANLRPCAMIFADPPDNLGLDYEGFDDNRPKAEYIAWFGKCLFEFCRIAPVVWISFNAQWFLDFAPIFNECRDHFDYEFKPCVQTYTFYQQNKSCLGNAHRPLWRLKNLEAPENTQTIKVASWRQLNGDKRAAAGGKVPGDVFDFPRVVGNSKQRRRWHPTQLNEGLVERCVKLNTNEGDLVIDPFAGTGTTLRVCNRINRECLLIESSKTYYRRLIEEFPNSETK